MIDVVRVCWAVLGGPAGKRLAPFLPELVARLRACGELEITDRVAVRAARVSAATIDRRLAGDRARLRLRGRSGTKPGSLLKPQIPVRTWAQWDQSRPGFVEIDLVGHDGGNSRGEFAHTLTATDVATGWTETRAVRNKARKWVFVALTEILSQFPFPVLGIDSDNGNEFINNHLLAYCIQNKITFTRSRMGCKNDCCYVEQKNWSIVRHAVGYARYDTPAALALLNRLYAHYRLITNFFTPKQKLTGKTRDGAKITKKHDTAQTPHQRIQAHPRIPRKIKATLTRHYQPLNPAQIRRDITDLQHQLTHHAATHPHPAPTPEPTTPPAGIPKRGNE
ncbi:ISNCY family transposase, partial [Allokutzneria sp. A3M-2-11 16]|uniref:integrase catalytic domain-containing protein n=1 Tax=Allokutzneria sp. A3M-2-11 16 TaxID=2962043 RepID=UPI00273A6C76